MTLNRKKIITTLHYILMLTVAVIMLIPFFWMISSSLKTPEEVFRIPPSWFPETVNWSNYTRSFEFMPVILYTRNTVLITLLCIIGYLTSGSLVAYAFSRLRWPGRDAFFIILLATMMLPAQVTIIPLFVIFRKLNWLNSYKPLIVPAFLTGWPFFIFLMKQYFLTIPHDLSEAAKVDGASHFFIFRKIILPLAKPALAVVAIFAFLLHWNDFFGPLIYLTEDYKSTLALGLAVFAGKHPSEWSILMSVSVVMLIPTVIVFFFCQRYFVEGITLTGMKS